MSNGSLDLSEESEILVGELVTLASPPLSEVFEAHADLASLDLSEESETTLASSMAASSGPLAGSAASGSIGSLISMISVQYRYCDTTKMMVCTEN